MPAKAIRVCGVVQGVGFRPMVWRLARQHQLTGEVWNDGMGVMIHVFGAEPHLTEFVRQIPLQIPPLASLQSITVQELYGQSPSDEFRIIASQHNAINTPVVADAATCPECLAEIADPNNRRYRYAFTNCTHCGPRLSIVQRVPYDRGHTSMAAFALCPQCQQEYHNPADRRFHAQATCCPKCGPQLWLEDNQGRAVASDDPIKLAAQLIRLGHIVAIKGLGGFHLACDASNAEAVQRLRERKGRYAKPFALMASDVDNITEYAQVSELERQALLDKAAPIVLLAVRTDGLNILAAGVAPGDDKFGFMLPYTPLHSLLMQDLASPIVLTSGNISDEPQCIDNNVAREKLSDLADYLLLHDRVIVNRLDDSVVRLLAGEIRLLRRARGYSPEALVLPKGFEDANAILAIGAELKNSFCWLKNGQAMVAQHVGDLENAAVQLDYRQAIGLYQQLYDVQAECIAVDLHPGYLSTQYGNELAVSTAAQIIPVQHHHAHVAATLAEHGVGLHAPPVLAAIFDGLGLGNGGELWGGEFLLGDYCCCTRLASFQAMALPGGHQAMHEPWRNTYAQLRHYFDWPQLQQDYAELEFMPFLAAKPLATIDRMISQNLNAPLSSSCGRWFDAFAAILGLHAGQVQYEGQAAIALEVLATPVFTDEQPYPQAWKLSETGVLSWYGLWQAVLTDLLKQRDKARIAARIHHSLIEATVALLVKLSLQTGADSIVLSGGVFQNRLLLEGVSVALRQQGKTVLLPQRYPMNDGGIALGQVVIAAARMAKTGLANQC